MKITSQIKSILTVLMLCQLASTRADFDHNLSDKGKCCKKVLCADLVKAKKVWTEKLDIENDCKACIPITKEDFFQSGTFGKTFVITQPGRYCLCEDICFDPQQKVATAIKIDSDNVILDLNGKTLQHVNDQSQVTGIKVKAGHEHVTIIGNYGAVKDFSQRGIYVEGDNKFITIGDATQLFITGCGFGTPVALIDGNDPILQAALQLGEMAFLAQFGFGPVFGLLENVTVYNVVVSENALGVALGDGKNYVIGNSSVSNNRETRPIWPEIGFQYFGSEEAAVVCYGLAYFANPEQPGIANIHFHNCHFDCNVADASQHESTVQAYCDSFAIAVNFSNLSIDSCTFNGNKAVLAPREDVTQFNQTRGCVIGGGSNIVIEQTEFSNNEGGGLVDGLNVSGLIPISPDQQTISAPKSITLRNCVASNNQARTNGAIIGNPGTPASGSEGDVGAKALDVVGFVIRYPDGLSMVNCVAEDNTGTLEEGEEEYTVFTDGILLFANINFPDDPTNNVDIVGAKLSRNRNNALKGCSSGVRVLDGLTDNVTVRNCVITENSLFEFNPDFFAAGVDITGMDRGTPSLVTVCDCVISNHATAGVFTSLRLTNIQNNKISFNGWGVLLGAFEEDGEEPGLPDCSTVLDNTLLSNGVAVEDAPSQLLPPTYSTSLVANNKAFNNGAGYLVTYEGDVPVPVEFGTLPSFPPYPPEVLCTNIEIVKFENGVKRKAPQLDAQYVCQAKNKYQNQRKWYRG